MLFHEAIEELKSACIELALTMTYTLKIDVLCKKLTQFINYINKDIK